MGPEELELLVPQVADLMVYDRNRKPVLAVEVQPSRAPDDAERRLVSFLKSSRRIIPFGAIVDKKNIRFFHWDGQALSGPICALPTPVVLRAYSPTYEDGDVFPSSVVGLVEVWLWDLAFHWKSETPIYMKQLEEIGLALPLADGATKQGVRIRGRSVH